MVKPASSMRNTAPIREIESRSLESARSGKTEEEEDLTTTIRKRLHQSVEHFG